MKTPLELAVTLLSFHPCSGILRNYCKAVFLPFGYRLHILRMHRFISEYKGQKVRSAFRTYLRYHWAQLLSPAQLAVGGVYFGLLILHLNVLWEADC